MARARWVPLIVDGAWNPELRRTFHDASGAYAIRHKETRAVEYVGESHTGRGWTTLTRHFQDASGKFATRNKRWGGEGQNTWTRATPGDYEAAVWVTSRGLRKKENGDEGATKKQAALIKRYRPPGNIDDGMAADDFAFGANVNPGETFTAIVVRRGEPDRFAESATVAGAQSKGEQLLGGKSGRISVRGEYTSDGWHWGKGKGREVAYYDGGRWVSHGNVALEREKNPPPLGPNVSADRRAENRTRDLFTGRTKLEEGGKARRDWKGDAERLAAELAACRRAPPTEAEIVVVAPPAPVKKPAKKPEGFGELDAKGQAGMFKRNPGSASARGLIVLGWLASIVYRDTSGRRRVLRFGARRDPALLAYRPGGGAACLVIVHDPIVVGEASASAAAEYRRTHWGTAGVGERLDGDVLAGRSPALGPALEITYVTEKGGEVADWWHTFGDRGLTLRKQPFSPPIVHVATVKGARRVGLVGGTYTVTKRGIVG